MTARAGLTARITFLISMRPNLWSAAGSLLLLDPDAFFLQWFEHPSLSGGNTPFPDFGAVSEVRLHLHVPEKPKPGSRARTKVKCEGNFALIPKIPAAIRLNPLPTDSSEVGKLHQVKLKLSPKRPRLRSITAGWDSRDTCVALLRLPWKRSNVSLG